MIYLKELEEIRSKINSIDNEIVRLFEKRMDLVVEVAAVKKELCLPILHLDREKEVLDRVTDEVNKDLYLEPTRELFMEIMKLSRGIQIKKLFPNNIVLIGFMGTGKSTIGESLSAILSMELIDTDHMIEKKLGMRIADVFESKGEAYFREIERQVIKELELQKNIIISCGGGVVLNKENVISLRKNGKIVWLNAKPEIIYERIKEDVTRPLIKFKSSNQIKELMNQRKDIYEQSSDIEINTNYKGVKDICNEVIAKIYNTTQE